MNESIPYGYCHCGCGRKTPLATRTRKERGYIKGKPVDYVLGHNGKGIKGKIKNARGYALLYEPGRKYIREHILVAERVLGKRLPNDAVVHHVNGKKDDNRNCNLVICENDGYHHALHRRKRAFEACGDAFKRKCGHCGQYDSEDNFLVSKCGQRHAHRACRNAYQNERNKKKREASKAL